MKVHSRFAMRSGLEHLELGFARLLDMGGSLPPQVSVTVFKKPDCDWEALSSDWMLVRRDLSRSYKREKSRLLSRSK